MKRTVVICILIALIALAALPCATVFAATDGANMCLINPVAVCAIGNNLFVADNVDDANSQSVILCFDISGDKPQNLFTYTVNKPIKNLSDVNGQLCVIFADSFTLMNLTQTSLSEATTFENVQAADVTYGKFANQDTQYFVGTKDGQHHLFRFDGEKFVQTDSYDTPNPLSCTTYNGQIYFLHGSTCKRFNGTYLDTTDGFNTDNLFVSGFTSPMGLFTCEINEEKRIAAYNEHNIYSLKEANGYAFEIPLLTNYANDIIDICFQNDKLFVLNSLNQVEILAYQTNGFETTNEKIGTDCISLDIKQPNNFSGFTLAKPKGYPTNIVYKTEFDNSIDEIKTEYYGEFVILDFDGSENLEYYYVLLDGKFGWVAKSDKNVNAQTDTKIEIINNNVSSDVQYHAKFISANAVHIYDLPLTDSNYTTFTQSLDDPQDVVVLQKFVEELSDGSTAEWYYVGYGENKRGFILSKNVGKFYASGKIDTEGTPVIGYQKINASLFEAVKLYATSDLLPNETVYNEAGEIKLYSGTRVVVVRQEKNASFVEIRQNDGTTTYGWVNSANLIGTHGITTNAIVGITILSVAVVLAVVLVSVFTMRKKRRVKVNETEE